jgi:RNA polymerase sigma-B factor
VAFATFAGPVIEGEIRRHLRDRTHPVRIPRELKRMSSQFRRRHDELAAALGHSPSVSELAAALGVEASDVERALSAERARDPAAISAERDLSVGHDFRLSDSEDRLLLASGVRALDERERRIVFLRFHVDMTERQIARELGISQAHVSRLLAGALTKLRTELARSGKAKPGGDITLGITVASADHNAEPAVPAGSPPDNATLARYLELPYHLQVRREHEGERSWWRAGVEELPGCSSQGSTPDEAFARLRSAMESWIASALAEQREIPVPAQGEPTSRAAHGYSGRFLVRMPRPLHEQLAREAHRQQVSLNRFVTEVLAASVASPQAEGSQTGTKPARPAERGQARAFRVALTTNLIVIVLVGVVAIVLLVLALERGI